MIPIVSDENKLRWKLEKFEELSETMRYSDKYCIKGTEWKIGGCTRIVGDKKNFVVQLCYDSPNQNDENWICIVNFTVKLLNQTENKKYNWKPFHRHFTAKLLSFNARFESFETFKKDDTIIVDIELDFKYYDFSKNIPNYTDIILKVEETEFYVNKGLLCSKSEYFYDLFVEKNSQETTINIENVTTLTFCYFIASFFPFFTSIQEEQLARLITLATNYGVATLMSNCEQFLISSTKFRLVGKFRVAEKRGLSKLKKSCIESLNSAQQIKQLQNTVGFDELDGSTKLDVMSRILDFF